MARFTATLIIFIVALSWTSLVVPEVGIPKPKIKRHGLTGSNDPKAIAARYWGVTAECSPTRVHIVWTQLDWDVLGQAYVNGCWVGAGLRKIWLNAEAEKMSAGEWCEIIRHEYGHLIGLEHSSNPEDVMFPSIGKVRSDCARASWPR